MTMLHCSRPKCEFKTRSISKMGKHYRKVHANSLKRSMRNGHKKGFHPKGNPISLDEIKKGLLETGTQLGLQTGVLKQVNGVVPDWERIFDYGVKIGMALATKGAVK